MYPKKSLLNSVLVLSASIALSGCDWIVMKPHGDIAQQQAQLIVTSTLLMLLIIVPVIALTLYFAFRYRQSNTEATYDPDWDHSTRLELVIWGAPLLIIIALGAITWISTHKLDPFRPLDRISENKPLPADVKPMEVYAVSMDWKWLFIYPEQGIATVNELAAPVDRPIRFRFTSTTVMNTFYVPALAGMIYTMPGMETQLNAVINKAGIYDGLSAHYSGAGFSDMRFKFHGLSNEDFAAWVGKNKAGGNTLTRADYMKLEQPSTKDPVQRFASVEPGLWGAIVDRCVDDRKMCVSQMMAIDAAGGAGKGGLASTMRSPWRDADGAKRERIVVAALCTPTNPLGLPIEIDATTTGVAPKN
ncbi:ubiquinol oxidase subunit II [Roseateles sp. LYH14W]|uniref:Ubiquinol oxidase subunit 2 n=1 Tax=Pelomonas parva TaxID=3299032 RepID=A0ABW7EVD8_9BURK